jgi:hypothetical protein
LPRGKGSKFLSNDLSVLKIRINLPLSRRPNSAD